MHICAYSVFAYFYIFSAYICIWIFAYKCIFGICILLYVLAYKTYIFHISFVHIVHIFCIFGIAYSCIFWNAYFCILMHILQIYAYFAYICIFWVYLHMYHLHFFQAQSGANWWCWILWKIQSLIQGFQGSEEEAWWEASRWQPVIGVALASSLTAGTSGSPVEWLTSSRPSSSSWNLDNRYWEHTTGCEAGGDEASAWEFSSCSSAVCGQNCCGLDSAEATRWWLGCEDDSPSWFCKCTTLLIAQVAWAPAWNAI